MSTAVSTDLLDRIFSRLTAASRQQVIEGGPRFTIQHLGSQIISPTATGLDELHLGFDGRSLTCFLADRHGSAWGGSTPVFTISVTNGEDGLMFEVEKDSVNIAVLNGDFRVLFKALDSEVGNELSEAVRQDNHRLEDMIKSCSTFWLHVDYGE